jgi:hypothetical protein
MSHDDPAQPSPEPLRLLAQDEDDLQIVSAALQDAILRPRDVVWEKAARRLTVTLSRFCWECGGTRVVSALQFGDVVAVRSRRLARGPDAMLELLAIHFEPGDAPGGTAFLMFAGGGDLRVDLECVDVVVADLTPRWPAQAQPAHPDAEASAEPETRA